MIAMAETLQRQMMRFCAAMLLCLILLFIGWVFHFAFPSNGLIFIAAFLICQTTVGTPLRQGIFIFIAMSLGLLFATWVQFAPFILILSCFIFLISLYSVYQIWRQSLPLNHIYYYLIYFSLLFFITLVFRESNAVMSNMMMIFAGSCIGIVCRLFLWRDDIAKLFCREIVLVLQAMSNYIAVLNTLTEEKNIFVQKYKLEKTLKLHGAVWVFEVGFNPGLRQGFRYFLLQIERLFEILCAMEALFYQGVRESMPAELAECVRMSLSHHQDLLNSLQYFFQTNKMLETSSRFSDMEELENALRSVVPAQLEILDISPHYVSLAEVVRLIKDMRETLLALRTSAVSF